MPTTDPSRFRPTPVLRPRRRKIVARVRMVEASGREQDVVVENVSSSGVLAQVRKDCPPVGEMVTLHLKADQSLWGVVRWVEGLRFGVEVDASAPAAEPQAPPPAPQSMCLRPTRK